MACEWCGVLRPLWLRREYVRSLAVAPLASFLLTPSPLPAGLLVKQKIIGADEIISYRNCEKYVCHTKSYRPCEVVLRPQGLMCRSQEQKHPVHELLSLENAEDTAATAAALMQKKESALYPYHAIKRMFEVSSDRSMSEGKADTLQIEFVGHRRRQFRFSGKDCTKKCKEFQQNLLRSALRVGVRVEMPKGQARNEDVQRPAYNKVMESTASMVHFPVTKLFESKLGGKSGAAVQDDGNTANRHIFLGRGYLIEKMDKKRESVITAMRSLSELVFVFRTTEERSERGSQQGPSKNVLNCDMVLEYMDGSQRMYKCKYCDSLLSAILDHSRRAGNLNVTLINGYQTHCSYKLVPSGCTRHEDLTLVLLRRLQLLKNANPSMSEKDVKELLNTASQITYSVRPFDILVSIDDEKTSILVEALAVLCSLLERIVFMTEASIEKQDALKRTHHDRLRSTMQGNDKVDLKWQQSGICSCLHAIQICLASQYARQKFFDSHRTTFNLLKKILRMDVPIAPMAEYFVLRVIEATVMPFDWLLWTKYVVACFEAVLRSFVLHPPTFTISH